MNETIHNHARPTRRKRRFTFTEAFLWFILGILTILLPNAFKIIAMAILALLAAYYLLFRKIFMSTNLLGIWVAVTIVTLFYIIVGIVNSAPSEAGTQAIIIYIIGPFLWIAALRGALLNFGLSRVIKFLLAFTALAIFSQAFYYWAYSAGRFTSLLELMAGSPNLDYSNNQVAAVMFVFGSMIFLYSGFFASPEVVENKLIRLILLLSALISAITSGRSALILGVGIGIVVSAATSFRKNGRLSKPFALNAIFFLLVLFIGGFALATLYDIDFWAPVDILMDKISSGGGAGRQTYLPLLVGGAADQFFLGSGHGIGVSFKVSEVHPWRYEVVGAADLFRVGILGFLIYASPFILALRGAINAFRKGDLDRHERYLFGTLVAGIFAANTNPYIEAVVFQWMFILPCTYFIDRTYLRRPPLPERF